MKKPAAPGWYPDPMEKAEERYYDGKVWTHETRGDEATAEEDPQPLGSFSQHLGDAQQWQYAVANVGMFNSADRMTEVLAQAGQAGWELVTVYDKASNWFSGMEKGFMLFKRPVPAGTDVESWCLRLAG